MLDEIVIVCMLLVESGDGDDVMWMEFVEVM